MFVNSILCCGLITSTIQSDLVLPRLYDIKDNKDPTLLFMYPRATAYLNLLFEPEPCTVHTALICVALS